MVHDPTNGTATAARRVLDRLAAIAFPMLLGALGIVLWTMLSGVVDGVRDSQSAIAGLSATVDNLAATINERTADLWTGTQQNQQQAIQGLIDTGQNDQLVDAKTQLQAHQVRLEDIAVELAVLTRRLSALESGAGGSVASGG